MPIRRSALSLAVLALACSPLAAHASTITQTFSTGPYTGTTSQTAFNLTDFNPALGTLNSLTGSFSGSYTVNANIGDSNAQLALLGLGTATLVSSTLAYYLSVGPGPNTFQATASSGNDSLAADLAFVTGTGTAPLLFIIESTPVEPITSGGINVVVTYNYTPFSTPPLAPTPEPAGMVLLGTGLIGIIGAARRRRVCSRAL